MEKLKKNISLILWFITILGGGGTFTIFGGVDWVRSIGAAPDDIKALQVEIQHLKDYQEMDWQFSRLMTDNPDTLDWYYANDNGVVYDIDIRHNTELVPIAFVFKQYMPYPIYHSPADDKFYIIVHDNGTNQNYYLYNH